MLVFKFGGASVKNADAVKNLAKILNNYNDNIVVVVSAMGKTTNALELIADYYFHHKETELRKLFENLKSGHINIMKELFNETQSVWEEIDKLFLSLEKKLQSVPGESYDLEYDQIVSYGELFSTTIVNAWLVNSGLSSQWIDIRKTLKTDDTFREAKVNWELSGELIKNEFLFGENKIYVTQGFIGSTNENLTSTLGREGSDYTAAILAYILDAEMLIVWKDVPGVLNADPKWFDETVLLEKLSYLDAIELAYYGASVIHPRTIQPLKKKSISMFVKSFKDPSLPGTMIAEGSYDALIPSFIFKMDQVLLSIAAKDLSFIAEDNLEIIIGSFAKNGLKINLMQNTATSFQVCVNNDPVRIPRILKDLEKFFSLRTENHLELVTIRYFDQATIKRVTTGKQILLEQHNSFTAQMVMRDLAVRELL